MTTTNFRTFPSLQKEAISCLYSLILHSSPHFLNPGQLVFAFCTDLPVWGSSYEWSHIIGGHLLLCIMFSVFTHFVTCVSC